MTRMDDNEAACQSTQVDTSAGPGCCCCCCWWYGAARSSFQFVDISQRRFLERCSPSLLPSFLPLLSWLRSIAPYILPVSRPTEMHAADNSITVRFQTHSVSSLPKKIEAKFHAYTMVKKAVYNVLWISRERTARQWTAVILILFS